MKTKEIKSKFTMQGLVTRQLFDSQKLAIFNQAVEMGITDKKYLASLLEAAKKPMFKDNLLWRIVHRLFGVDLRIPFLFGNWTTEAIAHNLIPTVGLNKIVELISGDDVTPATAIAVGTGTAAAAAANTALGTEITDSGLARGAATVTIVTVTATGDTVQFVKSFTVTGTKAVTEEGIFDNNTTGGILLARQVFSAINVASGDTLQITHRITAA